jgi:hypothetical protein
MLGSSRGLPPDCSTYTPESSRSNPNVNLAGWTGLEGAASGTCLDCGGHGRTGCGKSDSVAPDGFSRPVRGRRESVVNSSVSSRQGDWAVSAATSSSNSTSARARRLRVLADRLPRRTTAGVRRVATSEIGGLVNQLHGGGQPCLDRRHLARGTGVAPVTRYQASAGGAVAGTGLAAHLRLVT